MIALMEGLMGVVLHPAWVTQLWQGSQPGSVWNMLPVVGGDVDGLHLPLMAPVPAHVCS